MNQEAHTTDQTAVKGVWILAESTPTASLDDSSSIQTPVQRQAIVAGIVSYSFAAEPMTYDTEKVEIRHFEPDNITSQEKQKLDLNTEAEKLFDLAFEEDFEDGVESSFSKKLLSFIKEYGNVAIGVLPPIFLNQQINPEIISEALRWIGRLEHSKTQYFRLWLLESCLSSNSASIRDGAILGLASLNDPAAISYIKTAIDKEPIKGLQDDMKEILTQLETYTDVITG